MIVVDHVYTYFALLDAMQPNSKIETQNSNPYTVDYLLMSEPMLFFRYRAKRLICSRRVPGDRASPSARDSIEVMFMHILINGRNGHEAY